MPAISIEAAKTILTKSSLVYPRTQPSPKPAAVSSVAARSVMTATSQRGHQPRDRFPRPSRRPYIPIVEDHPFIIRDQTNAFPAAAACCLRRNRRPGHPDLLHQAGPPAGRHQERPASGPDDCVSCGQCVNACPAVRSITSVNATVSSGPSITRKDRRRLCCTSRPQVISQHYGKRSTKQLRSRPACSSRSVLTRCLTSPSPLTDDRRGNH